MKYKDITNPSELKSMLIDILERIVFDDGTGYIFLMGVDGTVYLHPDKSLIGTNVIDLQDIDGKYIIRKFVDIIKSPTEGYLSYSWSVPHTSRVEKKISFVKKLDMYDWYIGTGVYEQYTAKLLIEDILNYIKSNSIFQDGYIFISNTKKEILYSPKAQKLSKEALTKFQQKEIYQDTNSMAYTTYVPEYDWYITAVKEFREIQSSIRAKEIEKIDARDNNIEINLYFMLFAWIVSLLLSVSLSGVLNRLLKRYEKRLTNINEKLIFQSRQALIGELFPMIAHQWRQPINKIASILLLLRFNIANDNCEKKKIDDKLQEIEDSIEFMSETIDDFRTFYQPKKSPEDVNLKEHILKAIDFVDSSISKKDISIVVDLENITYKTYGNEFLQVMINLIQNATDSIERDGIIKIVLYKIADKVTISVEDTGSGIVKKHIKKIFDPYFSTKESSMGLGLYMSKLIVERHLNGHIQVTSTTKGTKFTIEMGVGL